MREIERKIFVEKIGYVIFRKNNRARRLTIRVKNNGQVNVTIPYMTGLRKALSFVNQKKDWILKNQEKFTQKREDSISFNEETVFPTVKHKVLFKYYPGKLVRKKIIGTDVIIRIPLSENIHSPKIQNRIRQVIIDILRMEAKEILVKRTLQLAEKNGFRFSQVKIKNMKTRWGSCSKGNTINLNLYLVRLPDHLKDYVILHELVHTIHKNHGKDFWKRLNELSGNAKGLSKELKNYSPYL